MKGGDCEAILGEINAHYPGVQTVSFVNSYKKCNFDAHETPGKPLMLQKTQDQSEKLNRISSVQAFKKYKAMLEFCYRDSIISGCDLFFRGLPKMHLLL